MSACELYITYILDIYIDINVCVYVILSTTCVYKLIVVHDYRSSWINYNWCQFWYHSSRIRKKGRRQLRFMCTANKRTKQGTSVWRDCGCWLMDARMDMDRYGYVRVGTSHCRLSGLTIPMFVHLSVCVSACLYAASPAGKCKQAGKASRGKAKKKQAKE